MARQDEGRLRLSFSIDKSNPAFDLLVAVDGLSERRQLGLSFLTQGAAAFKLGFGQPGMFAPGTVQAAVLPQSDVKSERIPTTDQSERKSARKARVPMQHYSD